jgi:hypothetical protein
MERHHPSPLALCCRAEPWSLQDEPDDRVSYEPLPRAPDRPAVADTVPHHEAAKPPYAAARPNVYDGIGLINPFKSRVFTRAFRLSQRFGAAGFVASVALAELQALYAEYQAAKAGECQ